jgi:hypothetical protein
LRLGGSCPAVQEATRRGCLSRRTWRAGDPRRSPCRGPGSVHGAPRGSWRAECQLSMVDSVETKNLNRPGNCSRGAYCRRRLGAQWPGTFSSTRCPCLDAVRNTQTTQYGTRRLANRCPRSAEREGLLAGGGKNRGDPRTEPGENRHPHVGIPRRFSDSDCSEEGP